MAQARRALRTPRPRCRGASLSWKTVKFKPVALLVEPSPFTAELTGYTANVVGSRIYIFGGCRNQLRSNLLFVFDYHTLSWLRMPIDDWRPAARSGHSTTLYKDVLIVYGGSTIGGRALGDVWKFDLVTGVFSMCSRLNTRRTGHTADLIAGRHEVLCFGGRAVQSANAVTNTLLRLDLETFTLREVKAKGEVPARRAFHSSCVCHDTIFIFGGFTDGPSSHLNDVHFLAPIVSQRGWSYVWHTPIVHGWVPRARLSSSWTYAWGYMFLIGGLDLHGLKPHMGDVHIFDPANKTWTQCSDGSSDVILDRIRVRPRCIATRDSHTTLFTGVSLISLRGSISDFDRFDVLGPASA